MSEITTSQSGEITDASKSVIQTDMRIRALTTMIHKLPAQVTHPSKSSKPSPALTAATHVATLLTHGYEGRRGVKGSFLRPIAVATHVTVDTVDVVAATDFVVTHNPRNTSPQLEAKSASIRPVESEVPFSKLLER